MYKETRERSYFPVLISYILYQIVLLQQATIKKNGPSKIGLSVLSLTVFCIYTRLQMKYVFLSWTTLGILLKFALCHFNDKDDYLEHFQLPTSM